MSTAVGRLEVQEADDRIVVEFKETVGLHDDNIHAIAAQLSQLAETVGGRTLAVDFGRVDFLTSGALGQFIGLHKMVQARGGQLVLCNVSPLVYEVFEITRLHTVLDVRPLV